MKDEKGKKPVPGKGKGKVIPGKGKVVPGKGKGKVVPSKGKVPAKKKK